LALDTPASNCNVEAPEIVSVPSPVTASVSVSVPPDASIVPLLLRCGGGDSESAQRGSAASVGEALDPVEVSVPLSWIRPSLVTGVRRRPAAAREKLERSRRSDLGQRRIDGAGDARVQVVGLDRRSGAAENDRGVVGRDRGRSGRASSPRPPKKSRRSACAPEGW
jgi:hypothetical protein